MPGPDLAAATVLIVKRTFHARREDLFRAWTDPLLIEEWFCPGETYESPFAEADVQVGGTYRIGMKPKAKDIVHVARGTYREILRPERLVFTWSWEGEEQSTETLVTVHFRDLGSSTEVTLKHELFPDSATRDRHSEGWNGCLSNLDRLFPNVSQQ